MLAHPLLVEAIEDLFVPLAIYNNTSGDADAAVRTRFKEPAWNYQVVRFLDHNARDLLPRKDRVWSIHPLATRMMRALEKARQPVPPYLRNLALEHAPGLQEAVFDTHCFHIGELRIPPLPGVVFTEAGWTTGGEAVRVRFDPSVTSLAAISREGDRLSCISQFYLPPGTATRGLKQPSAPLAAARFRIAADADRHWNLRRHPHHYLPLTPLQRTKLNALLVYGDKREEQLLSPRQLELLRRLETAWKSKGPKHFATLTPPEDGEKIPDYTKRLKTKTKH